MAFSPEKKLFDSVPLARILNRNSAKAKEITIRSAQDVSAIDLQAPMVSLLTGFERAAPYIEESVAYAKTQNPAGTRETFDMSFVTEMALPANTSSKSYPVRGEIYAAIARRLIDGLRQKVGTSLVFGKTQWSIESVKYKGVIKNREKQLRLDEVWCYNSTEVPQINFTATFEIMLIGEATSSISSFYNARSELLKAKWERESQEAKLPKARVMKPEEPLTSEKFLEKLHEFEQDV